MENDYKRLFFFFYTLMFFIPASITEFTREKKITGAKKKKEKCEQNSPLLSRIAHCRNTKEISLNF